MTGRRLTLLLSCLYVTLLVFPHPAGAQEETTLSLAAYWELVAETEREVAAMDGAPLTEQRAALAPLTARWEALQQVRLADGSLVAVSQEGLVAMLRADEPDPAAIADYLEALQEARRAWADDVYSAEDARQVGDRLDEILVQPEFQWQDTEPGLLERIWQWILRTLFNLLPTGQGNLILNYLLTALGALVLLAVLLYAARSLFGSFTAEAEREGVAQLEADLTAEEALARAQSLSRGGDYRTAVRYLYLSTLLLLDEHEVLRYDRSRTNREYLRSVAGRPEVADTLRNVVEVFDRTWYGYQPLDAESYEAYEAAVNALKRVKGEL